MRAKLTRDFVNRLEPDPDPRKRLTVWDTAQPGFGLVVTPYTKRKDGTRGGGVKSYVVQYRMGGRGTLTQRVVIGRHGPEWQPEKARDEAASIIRLRRTGVNPFEERKRVAQAEDAAKLSAQREATASARFEFCTICSEFVDRYAKAKQPKSWKQTESALTSLGPDFANQRIDQIARDDITKAIARLGRKTPTAARSAHKALLKLYNWAEAQQLFVWHPMRGMGPPSQAGVRTRVLVSSELRAVWEAGEALGHPYGTLFQLLLVTGLRLNEVARLTAKEFLQNEGALLLAPERMKRKPGDDRGSFLLPLSARGVALVRRVLDESLKFGGKVSDGNRQLFSTDGRKPIAGFTHAKSLLDARLVAEENPLPHWTAHDLRRTKATVLQALGVEPSIIDRLQDHRDRSLTRTALHYQHWDYVDEKRLATERYAEFLDVAFGDSDSGSELLQKVDGRLAPR